MNLDLYFNAFIDLLVTIVNTSEFKACYAILAFCGLLMMIKRMM